MCPKCNRDNGWDIREYDDYFPLCVHCGYEDYSKPYKRPKYKTKGLKYIASYGGTFSACKDKEATVQILSASSKKDGVDYLVNCPLCNQIMKGKKNSCHRFYCNNKHKIRISNKEGVLQWD